MTRFGYRDEDLSTRIRSDIEIVRVPPKSDGLRHDWTCPKAMPLLRTGECNCSPASPSLRKDSE